MKLQIRNEGVMLFKQYDAIDSTFYEQPILCLSVWLFSKILISKKPTNSFYILKSFSFLNRIITKTKFDKLKMYALWN